MHDKIYSIEEIKKIVAPIARQHGVDRLYLFGSYARGEATDASDLDFCVDAPALRGLFALGGLYADLETAFAKKLDLVTVKSLQHNSDRHFVSNLEKERVLVYAG